MTDNEWAVIFYERHGSYCMTGINTFTLEAFYSRRAPLDRLARLWGGHVYAPPPSTPNRWIWRLYRKNEVRKRWAWLRPQLSPRMQARGDRKLADCGGTI